MITCEQLDGVMDELYDLTREMDGIARVREANKLLAMIERLPGTFVMQWRAAAAADLIYLDGRSMRSIAAETGNAFQAISQWLQVYGPTHYLLIRKVGGQPATLKVIAIEGRATKTKIKKYQEAGYFAVPTTWNILDGDEPRPEVDAEQLWQRWLTLPD